MHMQMHMAIALALSLYGYLLKIEAFCVHVACQSGV